MRNIITVAAVVLIISSCTQQTKDDFNGDKEKQVESGRNGQEMNITEKAKYTFLENWNKRNYNELDEIYADSVLYHGRGEVIFTRDGLPDHIDKWHESFADFKYIIHHAFAKDDLVALNASYSGIHTNEFKGIEASNNKINVRSMFFFRFDQGLIVEMWEVYDEAIQIKQMKGEN